jgi:hypothetical protein
MKKKTEDHTTPEAPQEGLLLKAAKVVGSAAGSVASTVVAHKPAQPGNGRFAAKNKPRLPRKQKKEMQKKAMRKAAA